MTVEIIEVIRDAGTRGLTHVTFMRDGETFEFLAGRHVSHKRIMMLARTLKFTEKGTE